MFAEMRFTLSFELSFSLASGVSSLSLISRNRVLKVCTDLRKRSISFATASMELLFGGRLASCSWPGGVEVPGRTLWANDCALKSVKPQIKIEKNLTRMFIGGLLFL